MDKPDLPARGAAGRSCNACRRRKIRCDREQPCSYCTKLRLPCHYPGPAAELRRQPENELLSRVKRIEVMLQNLEAKFSAYPSQSTSESGRILPEEGNGVGPRTNSTPDQENGKLVLYNGHARYVTKSFWTSLDEVDEDEDEAAAAAAAAVDYPTIASDSTASNSIPEHGHHSGLIFGLSYLKRDLCQFHPTGDQIFEIWQIFSDNVDPLLKMLHVPIIQRQILRASQDLTNIPPAFESLMFSIYYAAITSMQCSGVCESLLHEDRKTLLDRYRFGVEQALTKANFMSEPDMLTLQALTLYLICARNSSDKTYIWSMTGLLIRLAMKLGLHRDGVALELTPFLCEMRRRLWWQICILDIRIAEENDMDPLIFEHSFDTKYPANVNDVDLDICMTHPPPETHHRSGMLFTLIRIDVSYAARRLVFSPKFTADNGYPTLSLAQKNDLIDSVQSRIQENYLRHCDPKIPICFLAAAASKMVLAKLKLAVHHPSRDGLSGITHDQLLGLIKSSVEIIECAHSLRMNDEYSRWIWLFQKYFEWDALGFLLHTMSAVLLPSSFVERVWKVVDTFFEDWKNKVQDGGQRWQRLESLKLKALTKQSSERPYTTEQNLTTTSTLPSVDFACSVSQECGENLPVLESNWSEAFSHGWENNVDWNFAGIVGTEGWEMEIDLDAFKSFL